MIVLETERLTLRHFVVADAEFILELLNEPSFLRFIGDKGVRTVEDAAEYIRTGPLASYDEHGFGLYLVSLNETEVPIGMCGLLKREALEDVDIGFAFTPSFWGNGYATESTTAVMAHGKTTLGLQRIVAVTAPDNSGSIRVLKKLGMRLEDSVTMPPSDKQVSLFA